MTYTRTSLPEIHGFSVNFLRFVPANGTVPSVTTLALLLLFRSMRAFWEFRREGKASESTNLISHLDLVTQLSCLLKFSVTTSDL